MRERTAVRVTPRNAVTVALEDADQVLAYGVVADISDAGACVWTNAAFGVGASLVLHLTFPRESRSLQAAGRVVWEDPQRDERGALRVGIQWSHALGPAYARLQSMIHTAH